MQNNLIILPPLQQFPYLPFFGINCAERLASYSIAFLSTAFKIYYLGLFIHTKLIFTSLCDFAGKFVPGIVLSATPGFYANRKGKFTEAMPLTNQHFFPNIIIPLLNILQQLGDGWSNIQLGVGVFMNESFI